MENNQQKLKQIQLDDLEQEYPFNEKFMIGIGASSKIELDLRKIEDKDLLNINREIIINKSLVHPYKNRLYNFQIIDNKIFLFQEYQPKGDLFQYLKKNKLSSFKKGIIFYKTVLAIQFLHKKEIIHRDIKPENILLDKNLNPKICDFGWAVFNGQQRNTFCGTGEYMAPEVFRGTKHTYAVDIWSLGILLYEFLEGVTPFFAETIVQIYERIKQRKIEFQNCKDVDAMSLIFKILKIDPKKRISIQEILDSEYIKKILRQEQIRKKIKQKNNLNIFKNATKKKHQFKNIRDKQRFMKLMQIGNFQHNKIQFNKVKDICDQNTSTKDTTRDFGKIQSLRKISDKKMQIQKSQSGVTLQGSPKKKRNLQKMKNKDYQAKMSREVENEYNMRQEISQTKTIRKNSQYDCNQVSLNFGSSKYNYNKKSADSLKLNKNSFKPKSPERCANYLGVQKCSKMYKSQDLNDSIETYGFFKKITPNEDIGKKMFDVIGENQGNVGFAQFMNYMFLMLDSDQFKKTEFIFKLICPIESDKFTFNDLFDFYQMIDGKDHFAFLPPDQQKKEIELAETVYDMISKKNNSFVTLSEFVKFCQVEKENLSLFNFLNAKTKITKQNIQKRKAYNDIMQVIQKIELNAGIIQNFLAPENQKIQNHRFSKRLETLVQIQLIKNRASKREMTKNLIKSVNPQELETLKENGHEQRHKSIMGVQNFGVAKKRIQKKFQEMIEQIRILKNKIENIFKNENRQVIEEKLEKNIEEKNFSDKSKLAFINNPNWNIVTNMVQGINLSVNAVCSQEFRPVNKKDFDFVNTFEMSPYSQDVFDHFKFKDYAPYIFENLRREYGIHYTDYLNSLGTKTFQTAFFEKLQVMISEESAGKSGSFFFHTCDSKFLIKTIKQSEVKTLLSLLPQFHSHILRNPKTLINKFFGLHRMECFKNSQLQFKVYILVMNNVFENVNLKNLKEVYDLKGSTFQRETTVEESQKGKPKKDLNFLNEKRKIFLKESEKYRILESIEKDTQFLMNNNLIDYSLLIGIVNQPIGPSSDSKYVQGVYNSTKKSKYFIGIIDILTGFNTMKKGEFFTKRLFQGRGISCIPPKKYQRRFQEFVRQNIQVSKY